MIYMELQAFSEKYFEWLGIYVDSGQGRPDSGTVSYIFTGADTPSRPRPLASTIRTVSASLNLAA